MYPMTKIHPEKDSGYVFKLFDYLEEKVLPHGSGINGDWTFSYSQRTGNVRMMNTFSAMNEHGMYVAHIDFVAIINWTDAEYFKLHIVNPSPQDRYWWEKLDLRNYLTGEINYHLYKAFDGFDLGRGYVLNEK